MKLARESDIDSCQAEEMMETIMVETQATSKMLGNCWFCGEEIVRWSDEQDEPPKFQEHIVHQDCFDLGEEAFPFGLRSDSPSLDVPWWEYR